MYFDPGAGSLIIQALIGFLVAIPVLLGIYRGKVKAFFSKIRGRHGPD